MKPGRGTLCLILFVCLAAPAMAVSPSRVFVSGRGLDTSTCPITAPCRSFAYALTQVAAGGEIIALDTAGYGVANITQSVTIVAAPGATAFVAAGGNAIEVNPGATDVVTLRGLALTATGAFPTFGVDFLTGQTLNIENCVINGFNVGIHFIRTADNSKPQLQVLNCTIRNNETGLSAADVGPGSPHGGPPPNICYVTVANSAFTGALNSGLYGGDNSRVAVSDSVFAANFTGVQSAAGADYSVGEVNLDRCNISRNGTGVMAGGAGTLLRGIVRAANCIITGNDNGMATAVDGSTLSRVSSGVSTNTIEGNGGDGGPSGNYTAK